MTIGGHGNLLQYSCLENPHGQGQQSRKEPDTTEQLSIANIIIKLFMPFERVISLLDIYAMEAIRKRRKEFVQRCVQICHLHCITQPALQTPSKGDSAE